MEIPGCLCCKGSRLIFEDTPGENASSSFKFCNGIVHVKTAALFVAISALLLSLFSTVCLFFGVYTVNYWLDIVLIIINTIVSLILIWGLHIDSPVLMIPFIIAEIAQCAGFFILALYVAWYTITTETTKHNKYRQFDQTIMVISILIGIVIAGTAVWSATKCYHYLRNKRDRLSNDLYSLHQIYSIDTISTSLSSYPSSEYPWAHGHYPYKTSTVYSTASPTPSSITYTKSPTVSPTPPRIRHTVQSSSLSLLPYSSDTSPSKIPNHSLNTVSSSLSRLPYSSKSTVSHSPSRVSNLEPDTISSSLSRIPYPSQSTNQYNSIDPLSVLSLKERRHSSPSTKRRRVSFRSRSPDHSITISRSLCNEYSSSPIFSSSKRVYFPNQYAPINNLHCNNIDHINTPSIPPNRISNNSSKNVRYNAKFPKFIDSIRIEETRDSHYRSRNCPSPYSNLSPSLTQSMYASTTVRHSIQPSMTHSYFNF